MSENKPITAKQEANGIKWSLAKVANLKANPNNPRVIKDEKFRKLVESIRKFPKMMEIRPIVVNGDMVVLGGNMRLKACKELGLKEVPIIMADDLTDEQQREFIIKDNVGFGEWDFELLAKDWDAVELGEWGLDVPKFDFDSANPDDIEIPIRGQDEPSLPYDKLIQIELSNHQFGQIAEKIKKLCIDVGATVNIS
jgi:hypothetical protein